MMAQKVAQKPGRIHIWVTQKAAEEVQQMTMQMGL